MRQPRSWVQVCWKWAVSVTNQTPNAARTAKLTLQKDMPIMTLPLLGGRGVSRSGARQHSDGTYQRMAIVES